jgi:predicted dehydrogenase
MKVINYGIVGFGGIAENRVAKEGFGLDRCRFHTVPSVHLEGAFDTNQDRSKAAGKLGIKWYASYEELLAQDTIDAIYVATSNSTHYEIARRALLANKHVIIEKPMTTSLEDAKDLMRIAKERSLSISTNLMMTKNVYNIKARDLLSRKKIGEPDYASFHMEFLYGADKAEAKTWRCAIPEEYGGPIGDVGGHCLDMAEFLFQQKISSIQCVYYPKTLDIAVEDGAFIIYTLENGLQGNIRVAFNQSRGGLFGTLNNFGYEIYGDCGIMRGYGTLFQLSGHRDEPIRIRLEVETPDYSNTYSLSNPVNLYRAQIEEHADSIRNNTPIDGSQGFHNVALVQACHESGKQGGKKVELDYDI